MKMRIINIISSFIFMAVNCQFITGQVQTVSEMRKVMMGTDLSAHLYWDSISHEHLFGISPLGRIEGEITIIDGKPFVATVTKDGTIQLKEDWKVEAPFAVYAHVNEWEKFEFNETISDETDLQNKIAAFAKAQGYDISKPFPFRISGDFTEIGFHIISKPPDEKEHDHDLHDKAKKHFILEHIKGELLGFYSQNHQGVFTHRGSFVHTHFIDDAHKNMGHVEEIEAEKGKLTLLLPKKTDTQGALKLTPPLFIRVNDTDFSKGRLGNVQNIELQDLAKFHGHLCDGLAEGFLALREGLYALYPDSVVDRTNTRIISKPSPCLTDVAIFLTGGRYQFNTFYVSSEIQGMYVVQRIDNHKTVLIKRKPNIKPAIIDEMGSKAITGELSACELDVLKKHEDDYTDFLLKSVPSDIFEVIVMSDFEWKPVLKNDFLKMDILNKGKSRCN